VIAQDQATSEFFENAANGYRHRDVDFILPLASIAPKVLSLVG